MIGKWISARQAREIVAPGWKHNGGPTDVICQRARVGLVKAKASLFVSTTGGQKSEKSNHPISKEFWGGEILTQKWAQGDFSTSMHSGGREIYCEAYGVTFEQSGILAMTPGDKPATSASQPTVPDQRAKGGSPGKYDWAKAVGAIIFKWSDIGDWHPASQGEIQTELADWFSAQHQIPDDRQLKKYARWLFPEFKKRNSTAE